LGLGLVFAAIALLFLSITALGILSLLNIDLNDLIDLSVVILVLGLFLTILNGTGQALCLFVPPEAKTRGLIIGSLTAIILTLVLHAVLLADSFLGLLPLEPQWLSLATTIAALIAQVLFILFLRKLANYVGAGEQEATAEVLLLWWLVEMVLVALAPVLVIFFGMPGGLVLDGLSLAWQVYFFGMVGLSLVVFVMYCSLITGVREGVLRYMALAPDEEDE
jgi:hypothetical protein